MKVLSTKLDKSLDKNRVKKPVDIHVDANIKGESNLTVIVVAREKEVEMAQKRVKTLQKEIAGLRAKLEAKTGYEKYRSCSKDE